MVAPPTYASSTHYWPSHLYCSSLLGSVAMKKFQAATLGVLVLLLASCLIVQEVTASVFCEGKCQARCSKAGMRDRCLKYCSICCEECRCVPSGTYGNRDECPCYRDKLSSKHKPKCP